MSSELENSSNNLSSCACKGIRTCLLCENSDQNSISLIPSTSTNCSSSSVNNNELINEDQQLVISYHFCPKCKDKSWIDTNHERHNSKELFDANSTSSSITKPFIQIQGVFLAEEVITSEEERQIVDAIDSGVWVDSQSGRRKQDFGPKVNFKRRKIKMANFTGFPAYLVPIFDKIKVTLKSGILENFDPVELCHLEYMPMRGSSIDPHFDDEWLWGERLVTLNYLSSTYLTLTKPKDTNSACEPNTCPDTRELSSKRDAEIEIKIKMPPRSLLILSQDARYKWMHSIKRTDICERRVASTWREATTEFKPGGTSYEKVGRQLFQIASQII